VDIKQNSVGCAYV